MEQRREVYLRPSRKSTMGLFCRKSRIFCKVDVRLSSKYTSAKQAKAGTLLKGDRSGSQCLPIRCDMTRHITPLVKKLRLGVI